VSALDTYIGTVIGQETNRALLVKLKDPGALARSQGSVAALAQGIAPATIEATVYTTAAGEVQKALAARGIPSEVSVVEPGQFRPAGSSHVAQDIGFAIGGMGIVGLLWWLFSGRRK